MNQRKYQPPRSRVTAAIIAFLFGGFGAQKIYLRQTGVAIFMVMALIISGGGFLPIFAIFGIFDAIRLLNMSDREFDRRYNRYSYQNRRDDYLAQRRERQIRRRSKNIPTQRQDIIDRGAAHRAAPFKNSGIKKYKEYDIEGAIEDFTKGLEINPNDVALHFNLACAYSMTEQKEKGFYHLSKAVELGFKDFDTITKKDDLAYLRIQPEFESFVQNGYQLTGNVRRASTPQQKSNPQAMPSHIPPGDDVLLSQLNRLAELRKKGLLSQEEFEMEKNKLLRR